jgi:hypothetical protein
MSRTTALAKIAAARRLMEQAEAELRALDEADVSVARPIAAKTISELDRARARKALERQGFRR